MVNESSMGNFGIHNQSEDHHHAPATSGVYQQLHPSNQIGGDEVGPS